jgi:hypothetical protein
MSQSLASSAARAARGRPAQLAAPGASTARPARPARPAGQPRPSVRRPPLRVVQAPPTAGSPLGFAVICAALLGAGLIALLLLNTAVAQDSFGLQHLRARSQQLADQKQALIQSNDLAAAPAQLAAKAWAMGLVPAASSGFVRLPSGQVVGVANPAVRSRPPTVITSTTRTSTTSANRPAAPVVRAGPVLAPASPVATTAVSGTAPGLPPAAPAGGQPDPTTAKPQAQTTTR